MSNTMEIRSQQCAYCTWLAEPTNIVHSCGWHDVVAARLTLERPRNVTPLKIINSVRSPFIASVADDVFETAGNFLMVPGQCFPSYQLTFSPPHQQLATKLVTNIGLPPSQFWTQKLLSFPPAHTTTHKHTHTHTHTHTATPFSLPHRLYSHGTRCCQISHSAHFYA